MSFIYPFLVFGMHNLKKFHKYKTHRILICIVLSWKDLKKSANNFIIKIKALSFLIGQCFLILFKMQMLLKLV